MLIDEFAELSKLNEAIDTTLEALNGMDPTDDACAKLAEQLTKLTKIKQIMVETRLKDFDAEEKQHEFELTHGMKDRELTLKKMETERSHDLKLRELTQRQVEHDETFALKKREIDLKQADAEKPNRVSKDALVAASASIAGILIIVGYEKFNVIASKALGFVLKR